MTETWLLDSHLDAEVQIPGFEIHRADRSRTKAKKGRASGGAAIYARNDLASEERFKFSSGVIECIGVTMESINTTMYAVYRQPQNQNHKSTSKEFSTFINQLSNDISSLPTPTPNIVLVGDFNLPHANWETGEVQTSPSGSEPNADERRMVKSLYDLTLNNFLVQQVEGPTQIKGNTLDLMFTNNSEAIHEFISSPCAPEITDHSHVEFSLNIGSTPAEDEPEEDAREPDISDEWRGLNFFSDEVNWAALTEDIAGHDWANEFEGKAPSGLHEAFSLKCLQFAKAHVPQRKSSNQSKNHIPPARRRLMRSRTRIRRRKMSSDSAATKSSCEKQLANIERKLRTSYAQQRDFEEDKATSSIKTNPKFFFSYAKKHSTAKSGIGPLRTPENTLTSSPSKMAELLSQQYKSAFSNPCHPETDPGDLFPSDNEIQANSLQDIPFIEKDFSDAMKELRYNAAAGPDGIPAIFLNKCNSALALPLLLLWQKCFNEGVTPAACKTAIIVPIHKGKSKAVPKNYRPVALTSQICKVFEKVVRKHMVSFLEANSLLNPTQHGFRSRRSCLSQLLSHFDRITAHLDAGKGVDVVYLDFAKAFDKVDIGITLRKLKALGIQGKLGRWLMSFLTGRTQSVVVNNRRSSPQTVISGVPQGSVLGPLIFLVLLGDIDKEVSHSFISSFADDTRIGKEIDSQADMLKLQEDLNRVYEWAVTSNMQFNSDKFERLSYQANPSQPRPPQTLLSDDNSVIESQSSLRDLGVTMTNDARFTKFIFEKIVAVNKLVGWALRVFHSRSMPTMMTIWKSLIMSHLDYCSQLWSPSRVGEIQALESTQKAFLTRIPDLRGLNYWDQLKKAKLYSLERRRERYSVIYTWRILEGQVPNLDSTPIVSKSHVRRGRECIIPSTSSTSPSSVKNTRENSFAIRGPRLFNTLPKSLRDMTGKPDAFKAALDRFLSTVPDEPLIPGMTLFRRVETNSLLDWSVHLRHVGPADRARAGPTD